MCEECIPCMLTEDGEEISVGGISELDMISTELEISEALDNFISEPIERYNYKMFSLENKYLHIKTGNVYYVLSLDIIDCTNSSNNRSTVLYTDNSNKLYVRECNTARGLRKICTNFEKF